jgi:hypothetical protein
MSYTGDKIKISVSESDLSKVPVLCYAREPTDNYSFRITMFCKVNTTKELV